MPKLNFDSCFFGTAKAAAERKMSFAVNEFSSLLIKPNLMVPPIFFKISDFIVWSLSNMAIPFCIKKNLPWLKIAVNSAKDKVGLEPRIKKYLMFYNLFFRKSTNKLQIYKY